MALPLMAQTGFASAVMLAWGAAATIPILLHLLRRRRQTSVPWAAMHLLRQVIQQQSRRARMNQWLLLCLRVLVLLLLAAGLAAPFWSDTRRAEGVLDARPSKLWLVVIDTSYSMGYRADELSRSERARQRVAQLMNQSQIGDAFALVALDNPSRAVIGRPTFDSQALLVESQRLSDTATGCDLASALALASDIAAESTQQPNLPNDVEIVILSDLGSDAWQTAIDGPVAPALARLSQLYTVTLEALIDANPTNVAIEAVRASATRVVVGSPIDLDITLACHGQAVSALPVQLEMDGQPVASGQLDLAAGQRGHLRLQAVPATAGSCVLSVSIPPDNLLIDNRYDLVIEVRPSIRVLIVDGQATALNPWRLALRALETTTGSTPAASSVRVVSELTWPMLTLRDWDAVILDDLSRLDAAQLERIDRYVQAGGSVIVALGPRTVGWATEPFGPSLLAVLGFRPRAPSEQGDWVVDPLDYASPLVSPFAGFPSAGLLTTPIFRYWLIDQVASGAEVELAIAGDDPLIVRHQRGRGTVASILSAPQDGRELDDQPSWNAITTWPSFLPLAQQLVLTGLGGDRAAQSLIAGQPLIGTLPTFSNATTIRVLRPDQLEVELAGEPPDSSGRVHWSYGPTDVRGVYRVEIPEHEPQLYAVNIDPVESSLESIQPQSLAGLGNPKPTSAAALAASPPGDSGQLARYLLGLVGLLLIGESWLAWVLGRQMG